MFNYIENKSIFDTRCHYLVNPVNCFGVCGKGLALEFKNRFPRSYDEYHNHCWINEVKMMSPGDIFIAPTQEKGKMIIYAATKDHWAQHSELDSIHRIMKQLCLYVTYSKNQFLISIAIPKLGCGLGGLNWDIVKNKVFDVYEKILSKYACIEIYI